jgi:hypothetical protein
LGTLLPLEGFSSGRQMAVDERDLLCYALLHEGLVGDAHKPTLIEGVPRNFAGCCTVQHAPLQGPAGRSASVNAV